MKEARAPMIARWVAISLTLTIAMWALLGPPGPNSDKTTVHAPSAGRR